MDDTIYSPLVPTIQYEYSMLICFETYITNLPFFQSFFSFI